MTIDIYFHQDYGFARIVHSEKLAGDVDGLTSNNIMLKNYKVFSDHQPKFIRLISWEE